MPRENMVRLPIDVTKELARALRIACGYGAIGPQVEEWLWRRPEVMRAAETRGITRKPRPRLGQKSRPPRRLATKLN